MTVATLEPQTAPAAIVPSLWWDFATTSDAKALAKAKTPEKQAKAAGLDWLVEAADVYSKVITPEAERFVVIPGKKAIIRTDTGAPLSVMGGRYSILQNIRLFEFGDALVDSGLTVIGAGEFAGGKVVWVQFALPDEIVVKGDPSAVKPYLLLYTSHDGSRPFGALLTFVRVFCKNTFNSAIRGAADKYIIRHTPGAAGRVDEARRVLGLSFNASKTFEKIAGSLAQKPMTLADFREFTEVLIPAPTREGPVETRTVRQRQSDEARDLLAELFDHSPLLDGVPNNYWRAFNAVTEWTDHHRDYRASKENAVDDNKALSLMDGQASDLKGRALDILSRN